MKLRQSPTPRDTNENCSQCGQGLWLFSEYYWIQEIDDIDLSKEIEDESFCSKECARRFVGTWLQ